MKLLARGTADKEITVETRSLEVYDGGEIELKDIKGLLQLEVRNGGLHRHKQSGNLAVAHVSPWFSDTSEELL